MNTKEKVFIGCERHDVFQQSCRGCVIKGMGILCDLLDQKEDKAIDEEG